MAPQNPYRERADYSFWRKGVVSVPPFAIDPVVKAPFRISRSDRIATAGSCFAQHIAKRLAASGYRYLVTETVPQGGAADETYGMFTARYGNVYTARQLLQLFQRATEDFSPDIEAWQRENGVHVDPFRPQIEKSGFASANAMLADRGKHLAAVCEMLRSVDVFVFTLGLTEAWVHKASGAVVPIAPGVSGGIWNPELYEFKNFSASETKADVLAALAILRELSPASRVILTVSPVPLMATYCDRHVLTSTAYSKAALRVAAEEICAEAADVYYFPSYEIITSIPSQYAYYEDDLRSISPLGVSHVMRTFFKHLTPGDEETSSRPSGLAGEIAATSKVICDEEALDRA